MEYALKTRADNSRMKSILNTAKIRLHRRISGYTLKDNNSTIRDEHEISDIAWNEHARVSLQRIAKIARNGIPETRKPLVGHLKDGKNPGHEYLIKRRIKWCISTKS